jgi:hypothetical protein
LASENKKLEQLCLNDCKSEFMFFRRYAKQGSTLADLSLAIMFLRGQGTEVNIPAGKRHLIRAAKAGEPGAQYQLGYLLMYGIYMPQNIERSLNWFKRAVKSKVPGAQAKVNTIENMLDKSGLKNTKNHFIKEIDVTPSAPEELSYIEVITVNFSASYSHILEAARAQTQSCNILHSGCPPQWSAVTAPIIVLKKDAMN